MKQTGVNELGTGKQENTEMEKVKNAAMIIAATPEGEVFLKYLCGTCGVFTPSIVMDAKNSLDHGSTEYNEGRRSVYISAIRPLILGSSALNKIERPEVG